MEEAKKTLKKKLKAVEKEIKKLKRQKKGAIRNRWVVDTETPIFTQDKEYLLDFMPK